MQNALLEMWRENPREPLFVPAASPFPGCRQGAGGATGFSQVVPFPPASTISWKTQNEEPLVVRALQKTCTVFQYCLPFLPKLHLLVFLGSRKFVEK